MKQIDKIIEKNFSVSKEEWFNSLTVLSERFNLLTDTEKDVLKKMCKKALLSNLCYDKTLSLVRQRFPDIYNKSFIQRM